MSADYLTGLPRRLAAPVDLVAESRAREQQRRDAANARLAAIASGEREPDAPWRTTGPAPSPYDVARPVDPSVSGVPVQHACGAIIDATRPACWHCLQPVAGQESRRGRG